jgi:hypothetical protein
LKDTERESADGVGGLHTASVLLLNRHAVIGVSDVGDDGVEVETGIVLLQEGRGLPLYDVVIATLVPDVVVRVTELVESEVLASNTEDERAFLGRISILPI